MSVAQESSKFQSLISSLKSVKKEDKAIEISEKITKHLSQMNESQRNENYTFLTKGLASIKRILKADLYCKFLIDLIPLFPDINIISPAETSSLLTNFVLREGMGEVKEEFLKVLTEHKSYFDKVPNYLLCKTIIYILCESLINHKFNEKNHYSGLYVVKKLIDFGKKETPHLLSEGTIETIIILMLNNKIEDLLNYIDDLEEIITSYLSVWSKNKLKSRKIIQLCYIALCYLLYCYLQKNQSNFNKILRKDVASFDSKKHGIFLVNIISQNVFKNFDTKNLLLSFRTETDFHDYDLLQVTLKYRNMAKREEGIKFLLGFLSSKKKEILIGCIILLKEIMFCKDEECEIPLMLVLSKINSLSTEKEIFDSPFLQSIFSFVEKVISTLKKKLYEEWVYLFSILQNLLKADPEHLSPLRELIQRIEEKITVIFLDEKNLWSSEYYEDITQILYLANDWPKMRNLFMLNKSKGDSFKHYLDTAIKDSILNYLKPSYYLTRENESQKIYHVIDIFNFMRNIINDPNEREEKLIEIENFFVQNYSLIIEAFCNNEAQDGSTILFMLLKDTIVELIKTIKPSDNCKILIKSIFLFNSERYNEKRKNEILQKFYEYQKETILKLFADLNNIYQAQKMRELCSSFKEFFNTINREMCVDILENCYLSSANEVIICYNKYSSREYLRYPCLIGKSDTPMKIDDPRFVEFSDKNYFEILFQEISKAKEPFEKKIIRLTAMCLPRVFMFNRATLVRIFEYLKTFLPSYNENFIKYYICIVSCLNYRVIFPQKFLISPTKEQTNTSKLEVLSNLITLCENCYKIIKAKNSETPKGEAQQGSASGELSYSLSLGSEFDDKGKETLFSNLQKVLNLIGFYINSMNDYSDDEGTEEIDLSEEKMELEKLILKRLLDVLVNLVELIGGKSSFAFAILLLISNIKNVIAFFDDVIIKKYLSICLFIGWNKQYQALYKSLGLNFGKEEYKLSKYELKNQFIYYLSDLIAFSLLQSLSNAEKKKISKLFSKTSPKSQREEYFIEMCKLITKYNFKNRDEIDHITLRNLSKDYDKMQIYLGEKNVIMVQQNSKLSCTLQMFNLVTNFQVTISSQFHPKCPKDFETQYNLLVESFSLPKAPSKKERLSYNNLNSTILDKFSTEKVSKKRRYSHENLTSDMLNEIKEQLSQKWVNSFQSQNILDRPNKSEVSKIIFHQLASIANPKSKNYSLLTSDLLKSRKNNLLDCVLGFTKTPPVDIWKVNILYSPDTSEAISQFSIFSYKGDISEEFINFVSLLGSYYEEKNGENLSLCYKDKFSTIEFNLVNEEKNFKQRKEMVFDENSNHINILWLQNPDQNICTLPKEFDSKKPLILYIITPLSEEYISVRRKFNAKGKEVFGKLNQYIIETATVLNLNHYSSIRFFLNVLISTSQFITYYLKKRKFPKFDSLQNRKETLSRSKAIQKFEENFFGNLQEMEKSEFDNNLLLRVKNFKKLKEKYKDMTKDNS